MYGFSSDGLPVKYYELTNDKAFMSEVKSLVIEKCNEMAEDTALDDITAEDIVDILEINPLITDVIDDMVEEWKDTRVKAVVSPV